MTPMHVAQAINHRRIARDYYLDYLRFGSTKAKATAAKHYAIAANYELNPPTRS